MIDEEKDDADVFEIPNGDIQLGVDSDGLPRTDPVEKKTEAAPSRVKDEDEERPDTAKKERDRELEDLRRDRDRLDRQAREAAAQAEAERNRRLEAEGRLGERTDQAIRAHAARAVSDYNTLDSALEAAKERATTAEREHARAIEAGDSVAAAKYMREVSKAEATITAIEPGLKAAEAETRRAEAMLREHNEAASKRTVEESAKRTQQETRKEDPDEWISTVESKFIGRKNADFLRDNIELVENKKLNERFVNFAEYYSKENGPESLRSDEFREAVEEKFFPDRRKEVEVEDKPEPKRAPVKQRTASAPVSRDNSFFSSRNTSASKVKLPSDLAVFVRNAGLDPTKYALQVVEDIRTGKLPKEYLDPDYDRGIR